MKRKALSKRTITLALAVLIIAPLCINLWGCEEKREQRVDPIFEQMLSRTSILYSEGFDDVSSLPFNIGLGCVAPEALIANSGTRFSEPTEITLHGEVHEVISRYEGVFCEYHSEPINKALCRGENQSLYNIKYTKSSKELCEIDDLALKQKSVKDRESIDLEKARSVAEKYIEETLNVKYEKKIKLADYELDEINDIMSDGYYEFVWRLYERGVTVHSVAVRVNRFFEVIGFTAYPMANEETRKQLFGIGEEGYRGFTEYLISVADKSASNGIRYDNLEKDGIPELIYLHAYASYFVHYSATARVSLNDASRVEGFDIYIATGDRFKLSAPKIQDYDIIPQDENIYNFELEVNEPYLYDISDSRSITDCYGREVDCKFSGIEYIEYNGKYYERYYGDKRDPEILYDPELEKIISFSFSKVTENGKKKIAQAEAEAIIAGFMKSNLPEIDFPAFTLAEYTLSDNGYYHNFKYKRYINGFEAGEIYFGLCGEYLNRFDMLLFNNRFEIPAYDDETLLYTVLKHRGITDKIGEQRIERGALKKDKAGIYTLNYTAYYKTFDKQGCKSQEKRIVFSLPIGRDANDSSFDFLIAHAEGYREDIEFFSEHDIPNEIEIPIRNDYEEEAGDSYKPNIYEQGIPEFVDMEVDGGVLRFEYSKSYYRKLDWKKTHIGEYIYERRTRMHGVAYYYLASFDLENMELLSFDFGASGERFHNHASTENPITEEQATEKACDFLEKYKTGFNREDYVINAHVQGESGCKEIYVYFDRSLNGIETECITVALYECGAIGYIHTYKSPYTEKAPANIDDLFCSAATERLLPYLNDIAWLEKAEFNYGTPYYVYIEEKDAYAVNVSLNILLYESNGKNAKPTYYIPLSLYHIYDYGEENEE